MSSDVFGGTPVANLIEEAKHHPHNFEKLAEDWCILFADLVGSTEYKQVHGEMSGIGKSLSHNEIATRAVARDNRGKVVKYVGDGLMAMFKGEDRCRKALEAAVELIQAMKKNGGQREGCHYDPHEICTRVGIEDGKVWFVIFPEATVPDPQGQAVDVAARLCAMAAPDQCVCSAATFKAAGGEELFPNHSKATARFIRGIHNPADLVAVAPSDRPTVTPVPLAGHRRHEEKVVARKREEATQRYKNGDPNGAATILRQILKGDGDGNLGDPGNFHANMMLAELLLFHMPIVKKDLKATYKEAADCLYHAKMVRDRASKAWLLLAWVRIKQYEFNRDDADRLERALDYLQKAREFADDDMNTDDLRTADIYRVYALTLRAQYSQSSETRMKDLAEADQTGIELSKLISGHAGLRRAQYLSAHALAKIERGDIHKNEEAMQIARMLIESNDLCPKLGWAAMGIGLMCESLGKSWEEIQAMAHKKT